ncbi:MAG: SDR family NAD(P)-dependent oxidoreductase [Hyphomonas sp.]|nr:SDR family NAD(P)-dependent oxidoreductase [Hyphomonas sp.]
MIDFLEALATRWLSRRAEPRPQALAATKSLSPAVVITGGSSGLGLALARQFAQHATAVVLIARSQPRLDDAAAGLAASFPLVRIETLSLDVSRADAGEVIKDWLSGKQLYCDVLVNNAAVGLSGPFSASEARKLETLVETNIAATARLTRTFLPEMLARGSGGILSIASLGGLVPGPHQAAYYASKSFVISLSEAIRSEVSGLGVRVAVALPGPLETRFHARMDAEGALYRAILPAMTPQRAAASIVRGFRLGRGLIAPGVLPTLAVLALRMLPHAVTVPIVRWLLDTGRSPLPPPSADQQ